MAVHQREVELSRDIAAHKVQGYLGPVASTTDAFPWQYWCPRFTDTYLSAEIPGDIPAVDGTFSGNYQ